MNRLAIVLAVLCPFLVWGNPVSELDYQGRVLLNDLPFTGDGYFKYAITDAGNTSNYWANDGTASGEPAAHLTNSVFNGVFSTILGASPMTAIQPAIFNSGSDLYLRVWFSTATTGFSAMLPAQKIVSSAYAINAGLLGGSSASQIEANSVAAATNAITLAGDVIGLPHANSIAAGAIVDGDVNASAGISGSKIQAASTTNEGAAQFATGAVAPLRAIDDSDTRLNAFSAVNSIVASAPNSGFGIVGSNGVVVSVAGTNVVVTLANVPLDNVKWVALNGTAAGPGTISQPYDTPQNGYDAAAAAFGGKPAAVVIAAGDYGAATLTMSSGSVHVIGLHRPQIGGLSVSAGPAPTLVGFQTVEGIVVAGPAGVGATGSGVRFHNGRFTAGFSITGHDVIFQDCRLQTAGGPALAIATVLASMSGRIGIYQSSLENSDAAFGTIEIGVPGMPAPNVQGLDVIGCEIVNANGVTGPAVRDWSPWHFVTFPLKIFAHNYIKGPPPGGGAPAIADPGAVFPYPPGPPAEGPVFGIWNNTIYGDVGTAVAGVAHPQFHGNNMVYGLITFPGAGPVGWLQMGAGTGADAFGNIQHEIAFPPVMPDFWND